MFQFKVVTVIICAAFIAGCETYPERQSRLWAEREALRQQRLNADPIYQEQQRQAIAKRKEQEKIRSEEKAKALNILEKRRNEFENKSLGQCETAALTGLAMGISGAHPLAFVTVDLDTNDASALAEAATKFPLKCQIGGLYHGFCYGYYFSYDKIVKVSTLRKNDAMVAIETDLAFDDKIYSIPLLASPFHLTCFKQNAG